MIKVRIRNAEHETDLRFPISESELFAKLGEIHALKDRDSSQAALVSEVYWPKEFTMLKDRYANLDELNYLAKRMESFFDLEMDQFLIGISKMDISILQRLTPFRSVRDTFTVGEDIEQDSYSGQIKARLENLHGARREFGIHATAYELGQQKMYAGYFPRTDQVELSFQLSGEDYSQFYHCDLSGADARLVKELLTETIREKYGQTPQEFIECDSDKGMIL